MRLGLAYLEDIADIANKYPCDIRCFLVVDY